ncbi:MAG: orotidine-5'-phosphate decarboxylase [Gammaproteobacteria bacterium]|nr:orotidine-5'-phosphate decarboxylase [Gammaproteobacteria bacterium]
MSRTAFIEQLRERWHKQDTMLCVGLDPDPSRLPARLSKRPDGVQQFCRNIVDATAEYVCAFKPQVAYFAALGKEDELAQLIAYIHENHPAIPVILDAKRGDIGSTARLYATEAFERFAADAVTVNPYPGEESIQPYLEYVDRGVIVLCRTSNPDSDWLQMYPKAEPVYLRVAKAAVHWNTHGNVMLVAGATFPEELGAIRAVVGDMGLLVPGVGAQGGDLHSVITLGCNSGGVGLVINASRSVLYAGVGPDYATEYAHKAAVAAREMRDEIRNLQAELAPDRAVV